MASRALARVAAAALLALRLTAAHAGEPADSASGGRELAVSTAKGNCLACHQMPGDAEAISSANIGPPLIAMRERFPERERLRAQIWDATRNNPQTVMPPFGKHRVLSEEEIDKITDYIHGL